MKAIKFIPENTAIDFIGKRRLAFVFSLVVLLSSLGMLFTKGLNFGIDFTGGTMIEFRANKAPNLTVLRDVLNDLDLGAVSIQEFGDELDFLIRLPQQTGGEDSQKLAIDKVKSALESEYGTDEIMFRRTEYVGPQVGKELKKAGFLAIVFSLAGIMLYIWFRFEWQFGVAAIIALAHDALATIGLFSLTQMEFNLSTVAAILMIAGYSINDTVVVFDRIRENLRKYKKKSLVDLFNMSINQMLTRTMITSITTLLALLALWAFGGEVIQGFVNALIFGIVIGTYSSIFVASPILLFMNLRDNVNEIEVITSKA